MTTTISVRLEKTMLRALMQVERRWQADRSEAVRRLLDASLKAWKQEDAIEQVRQHKISVGKAAEECGVSLWDMLDLLKQKNVDWTGYTEKDLEKDLGFLS